MTAHPLRRFGAIAIVLVAGTGLFAAATASAQQVSDRVVAEQILAELAQTPEADRAAIDATVAKAKKALDRATSARGGGDVRGGEMLEGLAREWAETARDVLRASAAEADAGAVQAAAADAGVQAERARALLEEAIARKGRAEAELERIVGDAGAPPRETPPPPPTKPSKRREHDAHATPAKGAAKAPKGTPKKGAK